MHYAVVRNGDSFEEAEVSLEKPKERAFTVRGGDTLHACWWGSSPSIRRSCCS